MIMVRKIYKGCLKKKKLAFKLTFSEIELKIKGTSPTNKTVIISLQQSSAKIILRKVWKQIWEVLYDVEESWTHLLEIKTI